jgi:IS30 family transposase
MFVAHFEPASFMVTPAEWQCRSACHCANDARYSKRNIRVGALRRSSREIVTKNGPAVAGYRAVTMKNALASAMATLPAQLRRSLTWDRGKELSQHCRRQRSESREQTQSIYGDWLLS